MNQLKRLFQRRPDTSATSLLNRYEIGSWLFLRAIALIYFAAFASLSVQITGLAGAEGILPFAPLLEHARQVLGAWAWLQIPTLFWINASDTALLLACYAGMGFAILLLIGRLLLTATIALFLLYLSLFHAGQTFMNFQWDYLLLEAGFLSILLTQSRHRLVIFLFHFLLFRLRFLSGLSKTSDPTWMSLDTLRFYFETQPLPHLGGWYFHQLPDVVLRTGTAFTLLVELLVPFFFFLPRRFRLFAAAVTILLQLLIIATSNHNWINLLTIALCLFLLDDQLLAKLRRPGWQGTEWKKSARGKATPGKPSLARRGQLLGIAAAVLIVPTAAATSLQFFTDAPIPKLFDRVRAWGLGNVYHVFPTMQTERHEMIIEGSHDGKNWQAYVFHYKPQYLNQMTPFIIPHQPRLDWMIWFMPIQLPDMKPWFDRFIDALKTNRSEVTGLLAVNPFADQPPRYIRVSVFRYHFTSLQEYQQSGNYWRGEFLGYFPYLPPRRP